MVVALGYRQQRELGSGVNTPAVNPGIARTGVGDAIENAASKAEAAFQAMQERSSNASATAALSQLGLDTENAFLNAQKSAKPGAPDFVPETLKTYDGLVDQTAKGLPDDLTRKKFRERAEFQREQFGQRAIRWQYGENQRHVSQQLEDAQSLDGNALFQADPASREELYSQQGALYDHALENSGLEPAAREKLRETGKARRSHAAVQADLRDRPAEVQDWVVGRGAGEGGYYAQLRQVESSGLNVGSSSSSAFGPYQFTEGTWKSVMRTHPELGLTEADRFTPAKQEVAIRAFTQDNIAVLTKAGIKASPANARLAHFLGAGGAIGLLRADKDAPASQHVTPGAVAANPTIFRPGRTVADVIRIVTRGFGDGDVSPGGAAPAYYADLTPERRDAYYSQAETEMGKRRVQGEAAFAQRVQNSIAEYGSTGASTLVPSEAEFVAAYGLNRGTVAFGEFQAKAQGAAAGYRLLSMPPEQHAAFVESQRPAPGDPFFAEKAASFAAVSDAAAKLAEERRNDPAQQIIRRFPQAGVQLADALSKDTQDQPAKLVEWVHLARANGSERILPNIIRDQLNRSLGRVPVDQGEATGLWADFSRQRQLWGAHWPAILRELGDSASDIRVIGSGISEEAATMLLANRKTSFADLTKPLVAGSGSSITAELQGHFTEYAGSLRLPGEDGAAFFGSAQKLAAIRMQRDNVGASDAAEWAYQELVGKRFVFEGVTRIPRQHEDVAGKLDDAKVEALKSADLLHLPPGVSREDAESWLRSNVQWATLPGDEGVVLMAGSQTVKTTARRSIVRSWSELRTSTAREIMEPTPWNQ